MSKFRDIEHKLVLVIRHIRDRYECNVPLSTAKINGVVKYKVIRAGYLEYANLQPRFMYFILQGTCPRNMSNAIVKAVFGYAPF